MNHSTHVAICVATFRRPVGLRRLLESFQDLDTEGLNIHLIVVDNDADASGRQTTEQIAEQLPFPVKYVVEPSRGLSHVRNRLIAEANKIGAEFVASADDDQTVHPGWVRELAKAAFDHNAAAVKPNLHYAFPANTPASIQGCFNNPGAPDPTGTPARIANSGGSLYRLASVNRIPGPFDSRVNFSGGEDSMLSVNLRENGEKIISCSTSVITEHMPETRLNFRWIANRAWWEGRSRAQEIKWLNPSLQKSLIQMSLFAGYSAKNALMIVPDWIRYRVVPLRRCRLIIFGISGMKHLVSRGSDNKAYATSDGG